MLHALIRGQERFGASPAWYLAHDDGYAVYRIREHWNDGRPAHELDLVEIVAVTPEAHVALWHVLLNIDLVGTITTRQLPVDDPLPYLLTNPRAVRTTGSTTACGSTSATSRSASGRGPTPATIGSSSRSVACATRSATAR